MIPLSAILSMFGVGIGGFGLSGFVNLKLNEASAFPRSSNRISRILGLSWAFMTIHWRQNEISVSVAARRNIVVAISSGREHLVKVKGCSLDEK